MNITTKIRSHNFLNDKKLKLIGQINSKFITSIKDSSAKNFEKIKNKKIIITGEVDLLDQH